MVFAFLLLIAGIVAAVVAAAKNGNLGLPVDVPVGGGSSPTPADNPKPTPTPTPTDRPPTDARGFANWAKSFAQSTETKTGIPWQVTVTQGAIESANAKSIPVDITTGRYSYNLFGVKQGVNWPTSETVECWTSEWDSKQQKYVKVKARFRAYKSFEDSFLDHARVLLQPRYSWLIRDFKNDPINFARGLQTAGYATSPTYGNTLVNYMRTMGLV